jgi:hypothetical protein
LDGPEYFTHVVDVMFSFTPHQSASCSFTACFALHGFYVLRPEDGWLTSKSAEVHANIFLRAFRSLIAD